jgi:hypothetical protein
MGEKIGPNLYAYVANHPVLGIDPLCLCPYTDDAGVICDCSQIRVVVLYQRDSTLSRWGHGQIQMIGPGGRSIRIGFSPQAASSVYGTGTTEGYGYDDPQGSVAARYRTCPDTLNNLLVSAYQN